MGTGRYSRKVGPSEPVLTFWRSPSAKSRSAAAPSDSCCRTTVSVRDPAGACGMLLCSLMVILQFLVVAAAFAVIDAIWLKTMNPFYRRQIW